MVKVYPPPVDELVERLRTFIEWEMWYRKKMFPNQLGLRRQKVQEAEAALDALEYLEEMVVTRKVAG